MPPPMLIDTGEPHQSYFKLLANREAQTQRTYKDRNVHQTAMTMDDPRPSDRPSSLSASFDLPFHPRTFH